MRALLQNGKRPRRRERVERQESDLIDQVVHINRVTKVVKGGKNLSFAALLVVLKDTFAKIADSLYSKKPFVKELNSLGYSFILAAKPNDHKSLFLDIEILRKDKFLDSKTVVKRAKPIPMNG